MAVTLPKWECPYICYPSDVLSMLWTSTAAFFTQELSLPLDRVYLAHVTHLGISLLAVLFDNLFGRAQRLRSELPGRRPSPVAVPWQQQPVCVYSLVTLSCFRLKSRSAVISDECCKLNHGAGDITLVVALFFYKVCCLAVGASCHWLNRKCKIITEYIILITSHGCHVHCKVPMR